jgi:hypothetical protein
MHVLQHVPTERAGNSLPARPCSDPKVTLAGMYALLEIVG